MPICINCSQPLPHLYTTYSKADDRTLGKGVRLTQCSNCKRFADKYVEHDYVVLFIDLVLIKPQVYRHLLFNRLNTGTGAAGKHGSVGKDRLDPSILRLGILLVLFDVYITWARIEKGSSGGEDDEGASVLPSWPIVGQYLFFLTLNLLSTLAQHVTIRGLAGYFLTMPSSDHDQRPSTSTVGNMYDHSSTSSVATERPRDRDTSAAASPTVWRKVPSYSTHRSQQSASWRGSHHYSQYDETPTEHNTGITRPTQASGSAISTALLVSSCTKLFPILLVIWPTITSSSSPTDISETTAVGPFASRAASYIGWVVLFNNIEALMILLQPESGYLGVTALAAAGFAARFIIEGWLLSAVGLARDGSGPVGDLMSVVSWIKGGIGIR